MRVCGIALTACLQRRSDTQMAVSCRSKCTTHHDGGPECVEATYGCFHLCTVLRPFANVVRIPTPKTQRSSWWQAPTESQSLPTIEFSSGKLLSSVRPPSKYCSQENRNWQHDDEVKENENDPMSFPRAHACAALVIAVRRGKDRNDPHRLRGALGK